MTLNFTIQYTMKSYWIQNVALHLTHFIQQTLFIPAQTTERFTNENWEIIMSEIAPPAIKQIIRKCVDVVSTFFGAVPIPDLLLP